MNNQEKLIKINEVLGEHLPTDQTIELITKICNFRETTSIKVMYQTLQDVENEVCEYFSITPKDINRRTREKLCVVARQFAHYKAKQKTNSTHSAIAYYFGGKNHATVNYSIKTIDGYLQYDRKFREMHEAFLKS